MYSQWHVPHTNHCWANLAHVSQTLALGFNQRGVAHPPFLISIPLMWSCFWQCHLPFSKLSLKLWALPFFLPSITSYIVQLGWIYEICLIINKNVHSLVRSHSLLVTWLIPTANLFEFKAYLKLRWLAVTYYNVLCKLFENATNNLLNVISE